MIVFDLKCFCGCQFEGWFADRPDLDRQIDRGLIACPRCGSDKIRKILSPVAIHSCVSREDDAAPPDADPEVVPGEVLRLLRSVQDFVEKNFDNVGSRLAEESLKIRYGVVEPRNIRGSATPDEEKMLREEGIDLLHIPVIGKPSGSKPH